MNFLLQLNIHIGTNTYVGLFDESIVTMDKWFAKFDSDKDAIKFWEKYQNSLYRYSLYDDVVYASIINESNGDVVSNVFRELSKIEQYKRFMNLLENDKELLDIRTFDFTKYKTINGVYHNEHKTDDKSPGKINENSAMFTYVTTHNYKWEKNDKRQSGRIIFDNMTRYKPSTSYAICVPNNQEEMNSFIECLKFMSTNEFLELLDNENFNALDEKFESISHLFYIE